MPFVARHTETGELDFAERANPDEDYRCFMCEEAVSYVHEHLRGDDDTRVQSHFRYNNCTHAGVKDISEHSGGGESLKHERRKLAAMHEASNRYPKGTVKPEYTIEDKRADAVLIFDEPHEKYGKGLAIEYQYKNDNKDLQATQEHYAEHEFTTLWITDREFNMQGNIPDIDLFGGAVYPVWPNGVPNLFEWKGTPINVTNINTPNWGEQSTKIKLPKKYYQYLQYRWYRQTDWGKLFPDAEKDATPADSNIAFTWYVDRSYRSEWFGESNVTANIHLQEWLHQNYEALATAEFIFKTKMYMSDVIKRKFRPLSDINDISKGDKLYGAVEILELENNATNKDLCYLPINRTKKYKAKREVLIVPFQTWWEMTHWNERFSGTLELPVTIDEPKKPTTPDGEIPLHHWYEKDGVPNYIKKTVHTAYNKAVGNMEFTRKELQEAIKRVPRIIRYNTGNNQPDFITQSHINIIASHCNINIDAVYYALSQLRLGGEIECINGKKYRESQTNDS